jgi:predicted nucleic acid-binding protein
MRKQYLLDTNILSELGRKEPNPRVVDFVSGLETAWLSMITLHEIEYGLNLLPMGKRRSHLEHVMSVLLQKYAAFIIPVDQQVAYQAARLRAMTHHSGRVLHLADSLIAGTAIVVGGVALVTRNVKDFEGLGLDLENPFL